MTDTQIASLALSLIGGSGLSSLSGDQTIQAVECRRWFDTARDEVLGAQPWNFAAVRGRLSATYNSLSGGSAIANNGSGLIRVGHTSHGLLTGGRVYMKDVSGVTAANGRWYVTVISPNAYDLDGSVFSGTYTSGTGKWTEVPKFGWDFWHSMPVDCLKMRRVLDCANDDTEGQNTLPFAVESDRLLCGAETAYIRYTAQHITTTDWPAEFRTAFAYLLGSYIAQPLSGPSGRSAELRQMFEKLMLPNAQVRDSREGRGTSPAPSQTESRLLAARR